MANDTTKLEKAKLARKDEFYTRYEDIAAEMAHYSPKLFEGKTVLCNCDDPLRSQFFQYFADNFERLGLKRLISTCYRSQKVDLFSNCKYKHGLCIIYEGDKNKNGKVDSNELEISELKGDGDFRSKECLQLLEESDIVVTNPPFSLFREFIATLALYKKQFLIIGNVNAISYKQCFSLIQKGKMWLGASIHSGDREFGVPNDYPLDMNGAKKLLDGSIRTKTGRIDRDGNKYIRVKGVRWFTNMEHDQHFVKMHLHSVYTPIRYPFYDNIPQVIDVCKTKDIPGDYYGIMGVPITFLDYYDPEQFEIVGNEYDLQVKEGRGYLNGRRLYSRIFIRRRDGRKSI